MIMTVWRSIGLKKIVGILSLMQSKLDMSFPPHNVHECPDLIAFQLHVSKTVMAPCTNINNKRGKNILSKQN